MSRTHSLTRHSLFSTTIPKKSIVSLLQNSIRFREGKSIMNECDSSHLPFWRMTCLSGTRCYPCWLPVLLRTGTQSEETPTAGGLFDDRLSFFLLVISTCDDSQKQKSPKWIDFSDGKSILQYGETKLTAQSQRSSRKRSLPVLPVIDEEGGKWREICEVNLLSQPHSPFLLPRTH